MDIVISVFLDLIQITKFFILCDYFLVLHKRKSGYKKQIIYVVTVMVSIVLYMCASNSTVTVLLYLLFVFGVYVFIYNEKTIKMLLVSLWSNLIIAILDEISKVIVVAAITVITAATMPSEYIIRLFKQVLTLLFLTITGLLLRKKHKMGIKGMGIGYYVAFTILSLVDLAILVYLSDFTMNKVVVEQELLFQIVFLFVSIGMLLQMAIVIFLAVSRNVYRENQQLASQYLNDQKKHYEYLETRERETKKFRHDLRNHMYILNVFNQQRDHEMLDQYMEKMNSEIDAFGSSICVNNGIVDAILNKFAAEAEKEGIVLQVEGHFPMKCNIHAFHLCTIFSNLLNNALEAERESQGNTIRMSCRFTSDHIIVCIENDSVGRRIENDGMFETTKKDKWNHGFGLENVKECVEQNEGELLIESEENTFRVTVVLNNEEKW